MNNLKRQGLTIKQTKFLSNKVKGMNNAEAARSAGYSLLTASSIGGKLMKNKSIIEALEQVGLSDGLIARGIKQHIEDGMGIKATADTSLRAIDLATRLKGYQDKIPDNNLQQNNISIELRNLTEEELSNRLSSLTSTIEELRVKSTS